jgi:RNA polymerase subunit RPABC4/transcription elongation factor Spt4
MGRPNGTHVQTTCVACQSTISADATVCTACHAPVVRRYCPKCSRLVPEHTKLCPYCGASSKIKPRDTSRLSTVAILGIVGLAGAFFLMAGFFPSEKQTKKVEPPPPVQLADNPVSPARLANPQIPGTHQISAPQKPIIRSDEEGTKLNLQAYELIQQKNYQQAEPILRRAVQSFTPGTTSVAYKYSLYNLGHVLRRLGKAKEAVPYLEQCVKIDPQWSKAQSELAIAKSQVQAAASAVTQISQM